MIWLKFDSLKTDLGLKTIRSHSQCLLFNDVAVLTCKNKLYLGILPFWFYFFFHSRKLFQRETQGETKGHESPADLKAQLESLGTELSFFMTFTGFQFTSHSKKTVEKSKQFCALYWAYWLQFICKPMFYFTVSRKTITLKYNKVWFIDKTVSE